MNAPYGGTPRIASSSLRSPQRAARQALLGQLAAGFVVGVLAWSVANNFGLEVLPVVGGWADNPLSFWICGVVGAILATTRARTVLWLLAGLVCVVLLAAVSSPWAISASRALVRRNPLQRADAIYVQGGGIHDDGYTRQLLSGARPARLRTTGAVAMHRF